MPETMPYQVVGGLRHLCNLLQTNSGDIDAVVVTLGDIKPEQLERFKTRCKCAWYWITQCASEDFRFALKNPDAPDYKKADISEVEANYLKQICEILPELGTIEEKPLSQKLYGIARNAGIEPKALFTATYQALIGKDQGPRLASFMKVIGKERLEKILKTY